MIHDNDKKAVRDNPASLLGLIQLHKHAEANPNDSDIGFLRDGASRARLAEYAYKMHQFAKQELKDHCAKYGLPTNAVGEFNRSSYRRNDDFSTAEDIVEKLGGEAGYALRNAFDHYGSKLVEAIRDYRKGLRKCDDYQPMSRHKDDSQIVAYRTICDTFQRSYWKVYCGKEPVGVEPRPEKQHYAENIVHVSPAWLSQVYNRGLSVIKDPKLRQVFVLQAKKREVKRLSEDGISVYKCRVIVSRNGRAEEHERWVTSLDGSDTPVHGIGVNLSDAEALLRRRTKGEVLSQLLDEL